MNISCKVDINVGKTLKKMGLGSSKQAQKFLGEQVERLCKPYVPFKSGALQNSANVKNDCVEYPGPYAHYQYTGLAMGGRAPKYYTGSVLEYNGAPMRGKEWEKRMMADRGADLVKAVEKYIKGRL